MLQATVLKLRCNLSLQVYRDLYDRFLRGDIDARGHRHDLGSHAPQRVSTEENVCQIMWPSGACPCVHVCTYVSVCIWECVRPLGYQMRVNGECLPDHVTFTRAHMGSHKHHLTHTLSSVCTVCRVPGYWFCTQAQQHSSGNKHTHTPTPTHAHTHTHTQTAMLTRTHRYAWGLYKHHLWTVTYKFEQAPPYTHALFRMYTMQTPPLDSRVQV